MRSKIIRAEVLTVRNFSIGITDKVGHQFVLQFDEDESCHQWLAELAPPVHVEGIQFEFFPAPSIQDDNPEVRTTLKLVNPSPNPNLTARYSWWSPSPNAVTPIL